MTDLIAELCRYIEEGDTENAKKVATEILKKNIDPVEAINAATKKMMDIGDAFDRGEIFLPQVVLAAEAMKEAAGILAKNIPVEKARKSGKFVIATVEGDVHDIGKGIVATLLEAAGFEVIDLGRDVPLVEILKKVKEEKPHIVGLSALMTTTRTNQKVFIDMLKKEGLRDKVKVMVGGGSTTGEWAEEIQADGWGPDAPTAVKKAFELLGV
ncbi:MAG: corrinoid protein [Candidatus Methanoglobus sp.]